MCQTIPQKIKSVKGAKGKLQDGREINLALVKKSKAGDWVLVNADLALNKISASEAKEILKLLNKK